MTQFETQICSRCHGSGKYSFCVQNADRCFKCGGTGQTFTKRGAAARAHYDALRSKNAAELQPGDVIFTTGITRGGAIFEHRAEVVRVEQRPSMIKTVYKNGAESFRSVDGRSSGASGTPSGEIDHVEEIAQVNVALSSRYGHKHVACSAAFKFVVFNRTDKANLLADALAFQDTLTKTGAVRKGRSK